ncbi:MAG: hypothetical protein KME32_17485 [Mojavia pulchra JT2-VF2]|jgi:hypothetical protein|uniref:Uncharacterized protein n=1 Tax=Mojavia pulchra JT2-VF2 TaxID=287848 RepID=A0A951Q1W1_9NOST|nr:hypothetical protein [Mojavia pulchra JT2-VF2]
MLNSSSLLNDQAECYGNANEENTKRLSSKNLSEYVAHLQLHMALQARNLVPHLNQTTVTSREQLLHQTQANFEKLVSRQALE